MMILQSKKALKEALSESPEKEIKADKTLVQGTPPAN